MEKTFGDLTDGNSKQEKQIFRNQTSRLSDYILPKCHIWPSEHHASFTSDLDRCHQRKRRQCGLDHTPVEEEQKKRKNTEDNRN